MPIATAKAAVTVAAIAAATDDPRLPPPSDGRWVFPVHMWRDYAPTRSQEYRAPDHHGVDIMFARRKPSGPDTMWPAGLSQMSGVRKSYGDAKGKFFVPDAIYACAARDGTIWECTRSNRGLQIVLDHGRPFATYYQHLSSVLFPIGITRGAQSIKVAAGQPLGVIGFDTSGLDRQFLMHLHFGLWYKGGAAAHVDPWPILATAPLPPIPKESLQ